MKLPHALLPVFLCPVLVSAQTIFVQPYVQPGNASRLDGSDVRVLTWITDPLPAEFTVEYRIKNQLPKNAVVEKTALDFPKYSGPAKPASSEPLKNSPTPESAPKSPPPAAFSLDDLKQSIIQSFSAIPEKEQHYIRYRAVLPDLPLDSTVEWSVRMGEKTIRSASVKTRSSARRPVRFAAVGDMASNRPEAFRVSYEIDRAKPDFLIALGDIVYPGGRALQYFNHFFPVYNDAKTASPQTGAPLMASVPIYPVIGNHDTESQKLPLYPDAYSCFYWFSVPQNGPGKGPWNVPLGPREDVANAFRRMADKEYPSMQFYSFDCGAGHFLVLDANSYALNAIDGLLPWIERDLMNSTQPWKIVCFHQPAFHTSKEHYTEQRMRLLQPLFERARVDLVLAGHVHNYQRSFPLRFQPAPEGRDKRGRVNGTLSLDTTFDGQSNTRPEGVIHVVSGGGGARLYSVDLQKTIDFLQKEHPENYQPLTAKYAAEHGFTLIDMTPDTLEVRQINAEGKPIDHFKMTK